MTACVTCALLLRVALALVEQLDLGDLHVLRERADACLQMTRRAGSQSGRDAAGRLPGRRLRRSSMSSELCFMRARTASASGSTRASCAGIRAHRVAQLLHQPFDATHGARVLGGKRFLAGEHVGTLRGFRFERRRDQRVDVRHHQLRVRDELRVLVEPHDAQITDDADGAQEGECDREADAHLAFRGRVPAFGAARGRLVAPLLQLVEQHADEHAHQQQEQPMREVERDRRTRRCQNGGNTNSLVTTPASAVANRPGRRPPM